MASMSDTFCDRVVGIKCMCFEDSNFRGMLSRALLTKKPAGKNAPGLPGLPDAGVFSPLLLCVGANKNFLLRSRFSSLRPNEKEFHFDMKYKITMKLIHVIYFVPKFQRTPIKWSETAAFLVRR